MLMRFHLYFLNSMMLSRIFSGNKHAPAVVRRRDRLFKVLYAHHVMTPVFFGGSYLGAMGLIALGSKAMGLAVLLGGVVLGFVNMAAAHGFFALYSLRYGRRNRTLSRALSSVGAIGYMGGAGVMLAAFASSPPTFPLREWMVPGVWQWPLSACMAIGIGGLLSSMWFEHRASREEESPPS